MRVVQINSSYGPANSTGRTTMEFHHWLESRKIESYVFTTNINTCSLDYNDKIIRYSSSLDQRIHAVCSRLTGLQGYFSISSTLMLIAKLRKINPDVVILRVLHSNCINFNLLFGYLKKCDASVVLVLHDCFFFTGHCCYYTDSSCFKWKHVCGKCPAKKSYNVSWLFDRSKKCLEDKDRWFKSLPRYSVVGVSDWITSEAKQSILKSAHSISRIYNWIDLDIFKCINVEQSFYENIDRNRNIILCVSSYWNKLKGLDEILFIAENLPEAQVLVIGQFDTSMVVPTNIHSIGRINDVTVLAKFYNIADVFINPSYQETFGKTTAEALCCGTPVVAYETTACTELVGTTRGKLTHLRDKKAFLNNTKEILKQGKTFYREECVNFAKNNFCMETNMQKYYELFLNSKEDANGNI